MNTHIVNGFDKFKDHVKKYKKQYIIGGIAVTTVVVAVVVTKRLSTKPLEKVAKEAFSIGEKHQLRVNITPKEAEAYNRVVDFIRRTVPVGKNASDVLPGDAILVLDVGWTDEGAWHKVRGMIRGLQEAGKIPMDLFKDTDYLVPTAA